MKNQTCVGQVNSGNWCQESYETSSRQASSRAMNLRNAGYKVIVSPMGCQVTNLGIIKLTMVTIMPGTNQDTFGLPTNNWKLDRI